MRVWLADLKRMDSRFSCKPNPVIKGSKLATSAAVRGPNRHHRASGLATANESLELSSLNWTLDCMADKLASAETRTATSAPPASNP